MRVPAERLRYLLLALAAVEFTLVVDFMMVMPLGPALMSLYGLSASEFGALVSVYTLASAGVGILASGWLDRFARRTALLVSYSGFLLATLGCGVAPDHTTLLVARALSGAFAGLTSALMHTAIADLVPHGERGRAMAKIAAAFGVSAVLGVPLSLALSDVWGTRAPFLALSIIGAFVFAVLFRLLPASSASSKPGAASEPDRNGLGTRAWLGLLLTISVLAASFLIIPYLGTHFVRNLRVSTGELSLLYGVAGATTLVLSRFIGKASDHFGKEAVLATLLIGSALTHLAVTRLGPGSLAMLAVTFTLLMVLTSSRQIPLLALVVGLAHPPQRARFMAFVTVCRDGAAGVAAYVAARMLHTTETGEVIGFARVGLASATLSFAALLLLLALVRARRGSEVALNAS